MKRTRNIALLLAVMIFGFTLYGQAISLTIGSGDYYMNVGDYDYLPYAYNSSPGFNPGNITFQGAMADYGTWVSMQPFGQVWRPYAAYGWRPYTEGHWSYTQFGPQWVGYEPWAWAGYHYGNWVYAQQYGWVWIPGHEWHPGRVAWSQGVDSIGWMPLPPTGYDYSRGYLSQMGPVNQFTYYDDDFAIGIGFGGSNYSYGGPYYDPRYRNMYYNPGYLGIAGLLWSFIQPNAFGYDNYSDYYYGDDYARYLFDQRLVRISSRPIERVVLERIVRQPIQVRQVRINEASIDGRRVRVVSVEGEEENVRKNANRVVREKIAPAFAEKGKTFKGEKAKNRTALTRAFRQENTAPRVETVESTQIVREARERHQQREQKKAQINDKKREEVVRFQKEGKVKERKTPPGQQQRDEAQENRNERSTRVTPGAPTGTEAQQDATRPRQRDTQEREAEQDRSKTRQETEESKTRTNERDNPGQTRKGTEQNRQNEREEEQQLRRDQDRDAPDQSKRDQENRENPPEAQNQEQSKDKENEQVESQDRQKQQPQKKQTNTKKKKPSEEDKDKDKKNNDQDEPPQE